MKSCPCCGSSSPDEAAFCSVCGNQFSEPQNRRQYAYAQPSEASQPTEYAQPQQQPVSNGKATAALVCGILSLFIAKLILGIIAIVLASQSKKELGYELPYAKAGRICGIIALCLVGLALILSLLVISLGFSSGFFSEFYDFLRDASAL